jgi:hypothetical protein
MRIALALAAFLAFLPNAHAATTSEKQFTPDLEFRLRYIFEDNQSASTSVSPNNGNNVEQRLKVGGQYKFSEKFSVTAHALQAALWGSQDLYVNDKNGNPGAWSSGDASGQHGGSSTNNVLTVTDAYGSWLVSDDFVLRFGRGGLTLGDGSVISTNDWQPVPTSFDGILGTYDLEFGRFSAWAIKFAQYDNGMAAKLYTLQGGAPATSGTPESDPEADAYGVSFDLKKMPEWLKMINLHVIQNTKANTPGAAYSGIYAADPTSRMGQSIIRYGIALGGAASMFDYKADYAGMNGNYYCGGSIATGCATSSGVQSLSASGYMAQAELGLNFPEFMKARIFAKYHLDSGDDSDYKSQTSVKAYDPYFYDRHTGSGNMEVIGWGNLTFYTAGLSVAPTDQTNVTLQYYYFQKTNAKGRMNPGRFGDMMMMTSEQDSNLGQEVDLVAEHKYDGGFTIVTSVGMFMPGSSVKNGLQEDPLATSAYVPAGVFQNVTRDSIFTQVMVQGKMAF